MGTMLWFTWLVAAVSSFILMLWSTWHLERVSLIHDKNDTIGIRRMNEDDDGESMHISETECGVNLDSILRFGSFYGIPLYYKKNGSLSNATKSAATLSVATFCDINYISSAKQIAKNFNGPISIAIYMTSLENEINGLQNGTICNTLKQHFDDINNEYDISISILYPDYSSTYYKSLNISQLGIPLHATLPFNALRNLAVSQVETPYVSMFDVDFTFMSSTINEINNNNNNLFKNSFNNSLKKAWIIPSFEWILSDEKYRAADKYLLTKNELLDLTVSHSIETFHYSDWIPAQKCTNYKKWYNNNTTSNYLIEYCSYFYEPYIIINTQQAQHEYPYDSDYIGRGCDKVQQIGLLAHNCFEFEVLTNMFIIHGYKESNEKASHDMFQILMERKYFNHFAQSYCNSGNTCINDDVCTALIEKQINYTPNKYKTSQKYLSATSNIKHDTVRVFDVGMGCSGSTSMWYFFQNNSFTAAHYNARYHIEGNRHAHAKDESKNGLKRRIHDMMVHNFDQDRDLLASIPNEYVYLGDLKLGTYDYFRKGVEIVKSLYHQNPNSVFIILTRPLSHWLKCIAYFPFQHTNNTKQRVQTVDTNQSVNNNVSVKAYEEFGGTKLDTVNYHTARYFYYYCNIIQYFKSINQKEKLIIFDIEIDSINLLKKQFYQASGIQLQGDLPKSNHHSAHSELNKSEQSSKILLQNLCELYVST